MSLIMHQGIFGNIGGFEHQTSTQSFLSKVLALNGLRFGFSDSI